MRSFLLPLLLLALCGHIYSDLVLTTCARMDTPVLEKVAQGLCITSCKAQNCGTGSCQRRSSRPVCVCSRCDKGSGPFPNVNIGVGKGKRK